MHQRSTTLDVLVCRDRPAAAALAVRRQRGDRARNAPRVGRLPAGGLSRHRRRRRHPNPLILALGDVDLGRRLHVAARTFATGALRAALAAQLAAPRRLARITAGAAFTLAIAAAVAGSRHLPRRSYSLDPLIAPAPPVSIADPPGRYRRGWRALGSDAVARRTTSRSHSVEDGSESQHQHGIG